MLETDTKPIVVPGGRVRLQRVVDKPVWRTRFEDNVFNRHGVSDRTRSLTASWPGETLPVQHEALPFADASLQRVEVIDVLELIRNDRVFYQELSRTLAPGGCVIARVPATGLLAGLDSYNLYKYLTDITKRGVRIPETEEIAFRRHLSVEELAEAFGPCFEVRRAHRSGTALSDVLNFIALTALTWTTQRADGYLRVQPLLRRLTNFDARIPLPGIGFWLTIEVVRL